MHERYKLTEARYFLARMLTEHDSRTIFLFEVSAFLAAARSVLQYALKEAQPKPDATQSSNNSFTGTFRLTASDSMTAIEGFALPHSIRLM